MARCHSFWFVFTLIEQSYNIYIYTTLVILIASLRRGPPQGVPSRDSNLGLPFSKPMRYNLSHTALYLSHTAPFWATLHPIWATRHRTRDIWLLKISANAQPAMKSFSVHAQPAMKCVPQMLLSQQLNSLCICSAYFKWWFWNGLWFFFLGGGGIFFMYYIQHCFICRPTESIVPMDAGIESRTIAPGGLAVRRSNHL